MDVNEGDREELLMPLSNESELSITAGKPSALELFMAVLFGSLIFLIIKNLTTLVQHHCQFLFFLSTIPNHYNKQYKLLEILIKPFKPINL